MKIKRKRLEELYALYDERGKYLTEHMENAFKDEPKAIKAFEKSKEIDQKIEAKADEIAKEEDELTSLFVTRLANVIYPKSLARCMKCLEVCGVEVVG